MSKVNINRFDPDLKIIQTNLREARTKFRRAQKEETEQSTIASRRAHVIKRSRARKKQKKLSNRSTVFDVPGGQGTGGSRATDQDDSGKSEADSGA